LSHNYPSNNAPTTHSLRAGDHPFFAIVIYVAAQYVSATNHHPISKAKPMFNLLHLLVLANRPGR
jgi:hypothetical protein